MNEILKKRNIIWQITIKNLKARYHRPFLGFLWAFLSPFFIVVVYYIVFARILKSNIEEMPFFLYLMSAVFPWRFFQDTVMCSAASFVDNRGLIKESNFPHYFLNIAIALENMINFLPTLLILLLTSIFVLKGAPLLMIFLPILLFIHFMSALGFSLIFSVIYVKFRDVKYILDVIMLFLFNLTPVFYSLYLVKNSFSARFYDLYTYNPFVGFVNLYRFFSVKGFYADMSGKIDILRFFISPVIFCVIFMIAGFIFYNKEKKTINDYITY